MHADTEHNAPDAPIDVTAPVRPEPVAPLTLPSRLRPAPGHHPHYPGISTQEPVAAVNGTHTLTDGRLRIDVDDHAAITIAIVVGLSRTWNYVTNTCNAATHTDRDCTDPAALRSFANRINATTAAFTLQPGPLRDEVDPWGRLQSLLDDTEADQRARGLPSHIRTVLEVNIFGALGEVGLAVLPGCIANITVYSTDSDRTNGIPDVTRVEDDTLTPIEIHGRQGSRTANRQSKDRTGVLLSWHMPQRVDLEQLRAGKWTMVVDSCVADLRDATPGRVPAVGRYEARDYQQWTRHVDGDVVAAVAWLT